MQKFISLDAVKKPTSLLSWPTLINALLFQITWFACALGAARGMLWPSILACAIFAVYQLRASHRHPSDIKLVLVAAALGIVIDGTWIHLGLISYATPSPWSGLAPIWIIALWSGFALTINHSLTWLKKHPLLPAAAGLICAPLSYFAGLKLQALVFLDDSLLTCCALGISWALALTLLVQLSGRIR